MTSALKARAFAAICGWLALAGPAHADEVSDMVARYRQWRGGPAFEAMQAVRMEGTATTSGLDGTLSLLATSTGDLKRDLDLGVVHTVDVRHGPDGWSLTQSGQIEDVAPDVATDLQRDALLEFDDVLDGGRRLRVMPDAVRDGRTFDVLAVDFEGADTHEFYFDGASGALYGLRTVRDRQEGFVRYDDWRFVEGVRMPFVQSEVREGVSPTSIQWREIDINPDFSADDFARMQVPALHSIAEGARSTGFMPFEFFGGNRIFVPVTVGKGTEETLPAEVLLDSGAEMTVLDLALANRLSLALEGDVIVQGTGGLSGGYFAAGVDIQLGPLAFHDLTVLVLDLEALGRALGRPAPIILGKDAFNALVVDVDFPLRRIAFHEVDGYSPPADAAEVELVSTGDIRAVRLSIEGRPAELFDFDTGNGSPLLIYPAYVEAERLLEGRPGTTVRSGGVGGARESRLATIGSVRLAGFEIRDVPTIFPPAGPSAVDSDRTVGNLGLGILGRFRLIASFGEGRAWLAADPAQLAMPFTRNRTGLSLRKEADAIAVDQVSPGSPAAEGGWRVGDRILGVDDVPAHALDREALRRIINGPAGRDLRFTIEDGGSRILKTRDYY